MFVIDTGHLKLQLEIVPVASLLLHEEVIPKKANELVLESRNWADLQNPIIVDENGHAESTTSIRPFSCVTGSDDWER